MAHRRSVGTRSHRKNRKRRRSIGLTLLFVVFGALLIWLAFKPFDGILRAPVNQPAAVVPALDFPSLTGLLFHNSSEQSRRAVYPYSVIPGGAESSQELRNAVAHDPVVAAHYKGFNLANARVIRLSRARTAYVSYRKGNDVFWTSNRMRLAKGETVITDDEHMLRTRCGNQISEVPRVPVELAAAPPSEMLETPLFVEETPPSEQPAVSPPVTQVQTPPPEANTGGIFIPPPIVPIIIGGGGGVPVIPPPPPPVPEPVTFVLLSTGLGAAWFVRKLRKN